jgi:glutathione peroxidase
MSAALHDIPLKTMTGEARSLGDYAGKVLLLVNVASKCGLTPQYEGLEGLYRRYKDRGLLVLGFPANDFLAQEPGTDAEIAEFCKTSYSVSFPLFSKIAVTGKEQHALYRELVRASPSSQGDPEGFRTRLVGHGITPNPAPGVLWNFEKFLIARDGSVAGRFAPPVAPDDPALLEAIEAELAKG